MSNIFFISDTHFGHEKILQFEGKHRPFSSIEEHDEALVDNWNRVVTPKDTVWHLGDVVMRRSALATVGRLNGTKHLIMGNHDDQVPMVRYLEFFRTVRAYHKFDGAVLSHIPVHEEQLEQRFKANIHGHYHSKRVMVHYYPDYIPEVDDRYINVSCEQINLTPIAYEELKKQNYTLQGDS